MYHHPRRNAGPYMCKCKTLQTLIYPLLMVLRTTVMGGCDVRDAIGSGLLQHVFPLDNNRFIEFHGSRLTNPDFSLLFFFRYPRQAWPACVPSKSMQKKKKLKAGFVLVGRRGVEGGFISRSRFWSEIGGLSPKRVKGHCPNPSRC